MITVLIAYLLGSIPFGLLIGRFKGIDVRSVGSGNIGATNLLRVGGKFLGLLTLLLDFSKGFIGVYVASLYEPSMLNLAAVASVIGHIYPIWLRFDGGKGVATAAGALLCLNVQIFSVAIIVWAIVFLIYKISSLSSLSACIVAGVSSFWFLDNVEDRSVVLLILFLVILRHRQNIIRLLRKEEKRV